MTLGGIKAVLITDVFQSLLMFAAIGSVVFGGTYHVGGFSEVINIAQDRYDSNPCTVVPQKFDFKV